MLSKLLSSLCKCIDDIVFYSYVIVTPTVLTGLFVWVSLYSCDPSGSGVMMMSKKVTAPTGLVSSTVNLIALSMEFMCCKNFPCVLYPV